jgi:hypothetical protein
MNTRTLSLVGYMLMAALILATNNVSAQSPQPYPHAVTDRLIHLETPMLPPPANTLFTDPDFGSLMIRATDATTNFKLPGTFLRTEGSGEANMWSMDTRKFYVIGKGGQVFVFGFDPSTVAISSLLNARPGRGFLLPLRPGASFSFVDPDLIYGTTSHGQLTIATYRFSTAVSSPVIDTRTCGTQPALGFGTSVVSDDDVSLSANDGRISISEGGPQFGKHMFVIVYDKKQGCRWYNTETGQIGGQWGPSGSATIGASYLIRHAYISRSGNYVRILTNSSAWYVWDLATLHVTACVLHSGLGCGGYGVVGYNSYVNGPGIIDDMQVVKRPLSNIAEITQLVWPLPPPHNWGQPQHFTWSNVNANDSAPVCGSTYSYDGDVTITQPFAGEIFCIETDGAASTVWRFAHNRATWITPYFNTQPLGSISMDGCFFLFTSDWDAQLGTERDGTPRSDVWIVKLQ